jgi:hypothetical protein
MERGMGRPRTRWFSEILEIIRRERKCHKGNIMGRQKRLEISLSRMWREATPGEVEEEETLAPFDVKSGKFT